MKTKWDVSRIVVHLGAALTLLILALIFFTSEPGYFRVRTFEHQTGKAALAFLILSLACTPANTLFGWKFPIQRKQALGVYGFLFAAVHLLIFLWLDYGFQLKFIWQVLIHSVYIWVGATAFLMLLIMAVTSLKKMKKVLKANWKKLHRIVYLISPLVVLHFLLVQKGNLLSLQGNLLEPLIYGSVVLVLLLLRLPPLKNAILRWRNRARKTNPV